jgi:hypothetical protein
VCIRGGGEEDAPGGWGRDVTKCIFVVMASLGGDNLWERVSAEEGAIMVWKEDVTLLLHDRVRKFIAHWY